MKQLTREILKELKNVNYEEQDLNVLQEERTAGAVIDSLLQRLVVENEESRITFSCKEGMKAMQYGEALRFKSVHIQMKGVSKGTGETTGSADIVVRKDLIVCKDSSYLKDAIYKYKVHENKNKLFAQEEALLIAHEIFIKFYNFITKIEAIEKGATAMFQFAGSKKAIAFLDENIELPSAKFETIGGRGSEILFHENETILEDITEKISRHYKVFSAFRTSDELGEDITVTKLDYQPNYRNPRYAYKGLVEFLAKGEKLSLEFKKEGYYLNFDNVEVPLELEGLESLDEIRKKVFNEIHKGLNEKPIDYCEFFKNRQYREITEAKRVFEAIIKTVGWTEDEAVQKFLRTPLNVENTIDGISGKFSARYLNDENNVVSKSVHINSFEVRVAFEKLVGIEVAISDKKQRYGSDEKILIMKRKEELTESFKLTILSKYLGGFIN